MCDWMLTQKMLLRNLIHRSVNDMSCLITFVLGKNTLYLLHKLKSLSLVKLTNNVTIFSHTMMPNRGSFRTGSTGSWEPINLGKS